MKILNEAFNIKRGSIVGKDGTQYQIAYIDPISSEKTSPHKDVIMKYRGRWLGKKGAWGWFLGNNPEEVFNNQIKPCLEYLSSVSTDPVKRQPNEIVAQIDQLINQVEESPTDEETSESIVSRLESFKQQLVSALSSDEFKKLIEPIIKFKRAQGHKYSFANALLIYIQDPKATMVKSKTRWENVNRTVKMDAKPIWLWVPVGRKAKTNKVEVTNKYLKQIGKNSVDELNPGEKEILDVMLNRVIPTTYKLEPRFFDIRYTEQMEGKEDLVGDANADVPWYDDSGEETDESVKYVEAMKRVIQKTGISLGTVDDMGGARGVSKSGSIDVLADTKRNIGLLNTLVHEFSHELLHQKYLKDNSPEFGGYFVGTSEGRGVVEQQAELSAWIVLRLLGYDMKTNINYVGIWGMDESNGPKVFDTVSTVANKIYDMIMDEVGKGEEELNEVAGMARKHITGEEIAKLLGCEWVYYRRNNPTVKNLSEQFKKMLNRINNPINY